MDNNIEVRWATPNDIDLLRPLKKQIHALHVEGNPKHFCKMSDGEIEAFFKEVLSKNNARILLAIAEGHALGYAVFMHFTRDPIPGHNRRNVLLIDEICVDSQMQGRGIGKLLMQSAQDAAHDFGTDSIELSVWEFNRDAIDFYEHIGMKRAISRYQLDLQ